MSRSFCAASASPPTAQYRALAIGIGVSIAVHAVALLALPGPYVEPQTQALGTLTASIVSDGAAPGTGSATGRSSPVKTDSPGPEITPEVPEEGMDQSAPGVTIASAPAWISASGAGDSAASGAVAPPAPSSAGAKAPGASVDASPASAGADAGLLRGYRQALMDAAKRFRRYPPEARERGWEGRVEIHLVVGADGRIKGATVKTSSRYRVLDDQALDMVKRGGESAPVPSILRGHEFTVDIPVSFSLVG